jgi:hypothetical protein
MFVSRLGNEYIIKAEAGTMARKEIYPSDFVHSRITLTRGDKVDFNGDALHMDSARYKLFAKSTICAVCGLKGFYYAKERHKGQEVYHLNLYGIDEHGSERLFTKDHIVPKWAEGGNTQDNYQTMCSTCNHAKGGKVFDKTDKEKVVTRLATQLEVSTDFAMPRAMIKPRRLRRTIENYCEVNGIEAKHAAALIQITEMAIDDLRKRIESLNNERNQVMNVVKAIHGKKRNYNKDITKGKGEETCQV